MGEFSFRNLTFLALFLILSQSFFPFVNTFAATNSSVLPPSNLAANLVTPDDVKLTWSSVYGATGYNIFEITDGQLILLSKTTSTSYTLNDLAEGSYRFVVSTLSQDSESGPSAPVSFDVVYPNMTAPDTLTYSFKNGNDIVLNWGASKYAERYNVYQMSSDGEKTFLTSVTTRTNTVSKLSEGQYTYSVSAVNSLYGESPLSNMVDVEVVYSEMNAPSNFTYTVANGSDVTLKWDSVPFATNYNLYEIINGEKVLKSTLTGTTIKFTNLLAGEYVYEVRSNSDRFGESAEGSELSVTVSDIAMAAPSNFVYKLQNINDIVLSWGSVAYATSYKIYQIIDGEKVLQSTVTSTNATFRNMPSGDYVYEVHSFSDRFGESAESSKVSLSIEAVTMAAPSNFTYKIQNGNDIVLSWESVLNANSYKIYQIVNGQKVLKSTVSGTNVTYANMPEGEYEYQIQSFSTRFGDSEESSPLFISIVHPTMEPPASVTQSIKSATDFTLSWDSVPYATNYRVYQLIDGKNVLKSTLSGNSVTYTNMAPGEYTYDVYAYSSRFGESAEGTQVKVALNGQIMGAPGNLTYSIANGNDIVLKWSSVQYANSYKIYQVIDDEKILSKTVTGTSVTFTNLPGGEYHYVVHSASTLLGESPEGAEVTISLVLPNMEAPKNLTAKIQNGNDVALSWSSVPYANSYKVYELVDGQKELKKTVTSLSTTLSNQSEGLHIYVVHSVSNRYGESLEGSEVSQLVTFSPMLKPENLTYTISNGNDVTLRWNASTYATNYNVYQIIDDELILERTVTSTSITISNLPEGDYKYVVHSYSSRYGESPEGSGVSITIIHPTMQPPVNLTNSITNGNDIVLRWNPAAYATSYKVYQIIDGQAVLERTVTGTSATFTNMPEGEYKYEVHSYSSRFGESAEGSSLILTLTWPELLPPQLNGSIFNANNITLTWPVATWANEYRVYQITNEQRQLIYKGTARSYSIYNLTEETHSFEVTIYSTRFGESEPSNRVTETIIYPIMEPPVANLKLLSETSARISWDFVTYANGYNIYEIIDGQSVLVAEKVNNLSYTITDMSYADHEYYVTSFSNSFGESDRSNVVLAKLIVDTEAPVTIAHAPLDWTNQNAVVSLSATDNETGVANTYYSLNDGDFVEGTNLTINEEGIHKISFYSVDKVGNTEKVQTIEVKVDKTAPITTSDAPITWNKEAVEIKLKAVDDQAGVAKSFYSINGSDFKEGTSFTVSDEGINQITFYSVDAASNIEKAQTIEVKIDKAAPEVTWDIDDEYELEDVLTINYSSRDRLSGIQSEVLLVNGSPYGNGQEYSFDQPGKYTFQLIVKDNAGWITIIEKTITVYIPVEIKVVPKVINVNKGKFTVEASFSKKYEKEYGKKYMKELLKEFELQSVTLNGISAIDEKNGDQKKAEKGLFKFNREDFDWVEGETLLEFSGMIGGQMVKGKTTVEVKINHKK